MAELYFKVGADYQEVVRLRQECERLEAELKKVGDSSPDLKAKLTDQLGSARVRLGELVSSAAKAGASLKELNKAAGVKAMTEYAKVLSTIYKKYSALSTSTSKADVFKELNMAIEANNATIAKNEETLREWQEISRKAFSEGNMAVFDARTKNIEQLTKQVEEMKKENAELNALMNYASGNVSSGGGSTRFFVSEEDYKKAKELSEALNTLRIRMTEVQDGTPEMGQLREEFEATREELDNLNDGAEHTAEVLGDALGRRAAESSSTLYELHDAVAAQRASLEELSGRLSEAKEHLDGLRASSTASEDEIAEAADAYESLREKVERSADELHRMKAAEKDAEDNMDSLRGQIAGLGGDMTRTGDAAGDMVKKLLSIGGITLSVGALKSFGQSIMDTREKFEDMQSTMSTFLGSQEKGAQFFNELKDYAWFNMDSFENLTAASEQLIAYGNSVDDLIGIIDQLSNVASATHKPLMQYVEMFNKAKSLGVVDAKSMQSWKAAGFMITDVLKEAGEQVSGTTVSFEQLQKALKLATDEGGFFNGVMDNMLQNTSALKGQLEDDITNMMNEIGESFQGTYNDMLRFLDGLVSNYQGLAKVLGGLIGLYGLHKASMLVYSAILKAQAAEEVLLAKSIEIDTLARKKNITMTEAMTLAQLKLNAAIMANPWILLVAAVAAATGALIAYERSLVTVENEQRRIRNAVTEANAAATEEVALLKKLQYELEQSTEGSKEYEKTKKKIIDLYGKYDSQLSREADMVKYLKDNYDALRESIIAANKEKSMDNYLRDLDDAKEQRDSKLFSKIQKKLDKATGENAGVYGVRIGEFLGTDEAKEIGELRASINDLNKQLDGLYNEGGEEWANVEGRALIEQIAEKEAILNEKEKALTSVLEEAKKDGLSNGQANSILNKVMDLIDAQYVNNKAHSYADEQVKDPLMESVEEAFSGIDDPDTIRQIKEELIRKASGFIDGVMEAQSINIGGKSFEFKTKQQLDAAAAQAAQAYTKLENSKGGSTTRAASEAAYQRRKNEEKNAEGLAKLVRDNEYAVEQARIDAMEDGLGKTLAQNDLAYKKEMDQIREQREARLKDLQDQQMQVWLKGDSNRKAKDFVSSIKTLPDEWEEVYAEMERQAKEGADRAKAKALLPYQTIEAQRGELEKAIDNQVDEIRKIGDERAVAIAEAMKKVTLAQFDEKNLVNGSREAIRKAKEGILKAQEEEFAKRNPADSEGLARLRANNAAEMAKYDYEQVEQFGTLSQVLDAVTKKWETYIETLDESQKARARLAGQKDIASTLEGIMTEDPNSALGAYIEELNSMDINELYTELLMLQSALTDPSFLSDDQVVEFTAKIAVLEEKIRAFKPENVEVTPKALEDWANLSSILGDLSGTMSDLGSAIGGNVGDAISKFGSLTGAVGQSISAINGLKKAQEEAAKQGKKLDFASAFSGIASVVGAVISVFSMIADAIQQYNEEVQKYYDSMRTYAHDVAMSMSGLQGNYDSIFGSDKLGKMHEYYEDWLTYQDKVEDSYKRVANLSSGLSAWYQEFNFKDLADANTATLGKTMADARVTTMHATWFTKAKRSTLGELYPELFNEDGTINKSNLDNVIKSIEAMGQDANNNLLTELNNLKDYMDTAESSLEGLKGEVSSLFGGLADEIGSGIINGIRNGTNAMDALEDAGLSVIDALERQMANSMLVEYMNKYQEKMIKAAGTGNEEDILSVVDEMLDGIGATMYATKIAVEAFEKKAKEEGWEMEKLTNAYQQSATSGAFATMDQDTGSELNGRFTALQIAGEAIRGYTELMSSQIEVLGRYSEREIGVAEDSRNIMAQSLLELQAINENTLSVVKPIKEMHSLVQDIRRVVNDKL